jgi:hypothetical protein
MVVRRVNPLSLAKVAGILYAILGLIIGAIFSLFSLVASSMMPDRDAGPFAMVFGVGAIIAAPIFYGILGFIMSLIMAALYNLVAGMVGGVEVDLQ